MYITFRTLAGKIITAPISKLVLTHSEGCFDIRILGTSLIMDVDRSIYESIFIRLNPEVVFIDKAKEVTFEKDNRV